MSCTHASTCPLFPKLNASLRGWRDAYCDSDAGWQECARFVRSRSGTSVPLTLLPNGKYAHTLVRQPAGEGRFASLPAARPADPDAPFEDAGAAPAAAGGGHPDDAESWWAEADAAFGSPPAIPTPAPTGKASAVRTPASVSRVPAPGTAANRRAGAVALDAAPARSAPPPAPDRAPGSPRPSWWSRVVTWLRSPA